MFMKLPNQEKQTLSLHLISFIIVMSATERVGSLLLFSRIGDPILEMDCINKWYLSWNLKDKQVLAR